MFVLCLDYSFFLFGICPFILSSLFFLFAIIFSLHFLFCFLLSVIKTCTNNHLDSFNPGTDALADFCCSGFRFTIPQLICSSSPRSFHLQSEHSHITLVQSEQTMADHLHSNNILMNRLSFIISSIMCYFRFDLVSVCLDFKQIIFSVQTYAQFLR